MGDLERTQKELDAALACFNKLKPSCVDAGVSYEIVSHGRKRRLSPFRKLCANP